MTTTNYPTTEPIIISKEKEAYKYWLILHRNFPKTERFNLGQIINEKFLLILESSFIASYSPPNEKIIILSKTTKNLDALKFFCQIAWENKLIPTDRYAELSKLLEEIGRMLGGWKKSLESKTPVT